MNKFRKLGFISYNDALEVHIPLLNVVMHDNPTSEGRKIKDALCSVWNSPAVLHVLQLEAGPSYRELDMSNVPSDTRSFIGASKIARDITDSKRSDAQIVNLAHEAERPTKNILAIVQAAVRLLISIRLTSSRN